MTRHIVCLSALSLSLLLGCGGGLQLNTVQAAHRRPSNVAVFFTVDTADGDPVGGLASTDFHIYEDGELVSTDESQQTIVNPQMTAEHYTLVLVDMSASVTQSDQVPLIEQAATTFTQRIQDYQHVGLYAFDGSENIFAVTPFTTSSGGASAGVQRLSAFQTRDPSTNLYGAIVQAIGTLDEAMSRSHVPLRFGTIVVFTDGTDRAARVSYDEMQAALDDTGYDVFTIGVGHEINQDILSDIGHSGHVFVQDTQAVSDAFDQIAAKIIGYTQRFYLLSYCSPARAGTHEVTVEATSQEMTGSLTYQFDAAGFGPNCNPNTPPPFDTRGTGARRRRPGGHPAGAGAGASVSVGAVTTTPAPATNPEAGDY